MGGHFSGFPFVLLLKMEVNRQISSLMKPCAKGLWGGPAWSDSLLKSLVAGADGFGSPGTGGRGKEGGWAEKWKAPHLGRRVDSKEPDQLPLSGPTSLPSLSGTPHRLCVLHACACLAFIPSPLRQPFALCFVLSLFFWS